MKIATYEGQALRDLAEAVSAGDGVVLYPSDGSVARILAGSDALATLAWFLDGSHPVYRLRIDVRGDQVAVKVNEDAWTHSIDAVNAPADLGTEL